MSDARLERRGKPRGIQRWFLRAPIYLYRLRLGFLMGKRFVMLEHVGRKSGLVRRAVIEVVANRPDAVFVASGWGRASDWFRNVQAHPRVVVHLGNHRFETEARVVDEAEAHEALTIYGGNHPKALDKLARLMVEDPGDTTDVQVDRVATVIPVVEFPKPT